MFIDRDLVSVIASSISAVAASLAATAAFRNLRNARAATYRQQRAYVDVTARFAEFQHPSGVMAGARLTLRNVGQTPAVVLAYAFEITTIKNGEGRQSIGNTGNFNRAFLMPGSETSTEFGGGWGEQESSKDIEATCCYVFEDFDGKTHREYAYFNAPHRFDEPNPPLVRIIHTDQYEQQFAVVENEINVMLTDQATEMKRQVAAARQGNRP